WEKNITLGEPPGFLHSWWCVFWDLYCAAPDRRETCEHSSEAKAFHDYVSTPSPKIKKGGAVPPTPGTLTSCFPPSVQPPVGVPGSQPLLPNAMDPAARSQGHPGMGGPMQRMNPPRGMAGMGPQSYGSGMRPPPSSLAGPGMPTMNMGPGGRGPWPNPNANSVSFLGFWGNWGQGLGTGRGPPNIPKPPFPLQFPMGPGPEGPMGGMSAMEPHHMNGSLGGSPSNLGALSNPPGTPRDDAELSSNFLNPFQSDS
uniref:Single stranded DNA binding protein 4 n=1 Tax=Zosterops lateralis melanops TaxID=1220523 RepID=A0A8D2QMT0_ZOSLA